MLRKQVEALVRLTLGFVKWTLWPGHWCRVIRNFGVSDVKWYFHNFQNGGALAIASEVVYVLQVLRLKCYLCILGVAFEVLLMYFRC